MRFLSLLTIVLSMWMPVAAQEFATDSLALNLSTPAVDESTKFSAKQLIAPAALIALGTIGALDVHNGVNKGVADWFDDSSKPTHADDYLRFAPSILYLGLGSIPGVPCRHNFRDRFLVAATSHLAMAAMGYGLKLCVTEQRPDGSGNHSFPSGHTAFAFTGAELMRIECGNGCGAAGYAIATTVAIMRLYNQKHWLHDVLMGAGIGVLSAHIGYWLLPFEKKLLKISDKPTKPVVAALPTYDWQSRAPGVAVVAVF